MAASSIAAFWVVALLLFLLADAGMATLRGVNPDQAAAICSRCTTSHEPTWIKNRWYWQFSVAPQCAREIPMPQSAITAGPRRPAATWSRANVSPWPTRYGRAL